MSDLESEIRALNLRMPSDGLDARVLAALQTTAAVSVRPEDAQKPAPADEASRSFQSSRKGAVVTSGWIVAAASMLTGIVVGRLMPPLVPNHGNNALIGTSQEVSSNLSGQAAHGLQDPSENSPAGRNMTSSVADARSIGSQIVESIWRSPAAAAVVWEQKTGQIFDVATHISDLRFDICRDCHRVGG